MHRGIKTLASFLQLAFQTVHNMGHWNRARIFLFLCGGFPVIQIGTAFARKGTPFCNSICFCILQSKRCVLCFVWLRLILIGCIDLRNWCWRESQSTGIVFCFWNVLVALLARDGFFAYCVVAQCFVVFENSRIVVKGKKIWRKVCGIFLILVHLQLPIYLLPRDVVDVLLIFVLLIRIFPPLL